MKQLEKYQLLGIFVFAETVMYDYIPMKKPFLMWENIGKLHSFYYICKVSFGNSC